MKRQLILTGILLLGLGIAGSAQDSLKLSMPEAEKMFIAGNYELIAQQYQTEQAKADVITAKLFDNPEISYENQLYNPVTKKFFQNSLPSGQRTNFTTH
jgi:cobalt-zinc-cadmium efflux system outer membrane protein